MVQIMARLAAGDRAAAFTLLEEFGPPIRAAVRRQFDALGVAADPATLDELTVSAVLEVEACSGGWRPDGGALPWVWANRRLLAMVSSHVGQHHDSLDAEGAVELQARPTITAVDDPAEIEVLRWVAQVRPEAALLLAALEEVTSVRDRAVLLAYEAYRADGDPSPARTVARQFELTPANARQIVKRAKDRVRALAGCDERFAPLVTLALLAR
ncbi:MAG: hypothetical protein ACR2H3_16230 [Acidimicrobiales bacterium]